MSACYLCTLFPPLLFTFQSLGDAGVHRFGGLHLIDEEFCTMLLAEKLFFKLFFFSFQVNIYEIVLQLQVCMTFCIHFVYLLVLRL